MNNLFDEKILNKKANEEVDLSKNNLSERRKNLDKWISMYESGVLENSKEEQLQGEFLYDIFTKVLNATNKSDGKTEWNLERETKTAIDGQKADGVLGFFNAKGEKDIRAVIELKGANISLDARQKREKDTRTPVEQAFGYAPKYGKNCQWVIVSNFKEIRLYRSSSMLEYQVFKLENLRDDLEFKKFIYVLSFYALVGTENKKAKTLELSEEFQKKQNDIEKKFYREYKQIRLDVFENMRKNNNINENILIEKVQKLLDRFLFICFCEDKDLIPANSYRKILERGENIDDIFESFKMFCRWIDSGNKKYSISKFNGGLFKQDEELDNLVVDNEVFKKMEKIADYDFDSELNENILGHIFEQSISDIEELKNSFGKISPLKNNEINLAREQVKNNKKVSKRKKDGIFYTPKYITKYIVENSINYWLENKRKELGEDDLPELTEKDEVKDIYKKKFTKNFKKHIEFWEKYREAVRNIKIVDPACGSGAFLIVAFEFLLNYNKWLDDKIFDMVGTQDLFSDKTKEILENNIYGVDLNKESIEITKLSLWLKTADKNKTLTTLEDNIKCGNSLIADKEIAGDLAFDWEKEFPSVFEQGGFDIVVGNPPYVDIKSMKHNQVEYFFKEYKTAENRINLYSLFIEKGIKLLNQNGILSYINPNSMLMNQSYEKLRNLIFENINTIIKLPDNIFEEAKVETIIFIISKKKTEIVEVIKYEKSETINYIDNALKEIFYKKSWEREDKKFNIYINDKIENLLIKIETNNIKQLIEISDFSLGITPYDKYRGHSEEIIKMRAFHSDKKLDENYKPLITGENILRYYISEKVSEYIKYGEWLGAKREERFFTNPRIIIRQIVSGNPARIFATYTELPLYFSQIGFSIISKNNLEFENKYILILLNSKLMNFFHKYKYLDLEKNLFQKILIANTKNLPIKNIKKEAQTPFIEKADLMLELNKNLNEKIKKFQKRMKDNLSTNLKFTKKLENFYDLSFAEFLKEISKQKIKLSLTMQDEWDEYFEIYKKEILEIKILIEKTDKEIDKMVYDLYELNEEEIKIIEEE